MPTDPNPTEYTNDEQYQGSAIYDDDDEEAEQAADDTRATPHSQKSPAPFMPPDVPSADDFAAPPTIQPVIVMAKGLPKEFVLGGDEVVRTVDDVSFSITNRQIGANSYRRAHPALPPLPAMPPVATPYYPGYPLIRAIRPLSRRPFRRSHGPTRRSHGPTRRSQRSHGRR